MRPLALDCDNMRKSIKAALLNRKVALYDDDGHKFEITTAPFCIGGEQELVIDYYRLRFFAVDVLIDTAEIPDEYTGGRIVHLVGSDDEETPLLHIVVRETGGIITAS